MVARNRKGHGAGRVKGSGLLGVRRRQEGWCLGPVEDLLLQVCSAQIKPEEDTPALVPGWRGQPEGSLWQVAGEKARGCTSTWNVESASLTCGPRTSSLET